MSYKIIYHKKDEKFLKSNKVVAIQFMKAFDEISEKRQNYDIKRIHHKEFNDIYRLRIGKYRAIFRVLDDILVIFVFDIGSRGQGL